MNGLSAGCLNYFLLIPVSTNPHKEIEATCRMCHVGYFMMRLDSVGIARLVEFKFIVS